MKLQIGSIEKQNVIIVQQALKFLGYNITSDGVFGKKTEDAIKQYQLKIKLAQTGAVGDWLFNHLSDILKASKLADKEESGKKNKTIVLTAGHNNKDPGAVNGKYTEAAIATETRNAVALILRAKGYNVITDGSGTDNQILSEAVKLIPKGHIAIELHCNAGPATAKGVEALSKDKLKKQSQILCSSIQSIFKTPLRGDLGWKSESSGQHTRLAFVSNNGIILELFFISNELELATYNTNKQELFIALADGIEQAVSV